MAVILVSPAGGKSISLKNAFIWSLLFGPFYFASLGVWDTAALSFVLAVVTGGLSVFVYPFFTRAIVTAFYLKKGWTVTESGVVAQGLSSGSACESCGKSMELDTISKRDFRYCINCQDQRTGEMQPYGKVRQDMIGTLIRTGKTKEEAETMVEEMMPKLLRWKVK